MIKMRGKEDKGGGSTIRSMGKIRGLRPCVYESWALSVQSNGLCHCPQFTDEFHWDVPGMTKMELGSNFSKRALQHVAQTFQAMAAAEGIVVVADSVNRRCGGQVVAMSSRAAG